MYEKDLVKKLKAMSQEMDSLIYDKFLVVRARDIFLSINLAVCNLIMSRKLSGFI